MSSDFVKSEGRWKNTLPSTTVATASIIVVATTPVKKESVLQFSCPTTYCQDP